MSQLHKRFSTDQVKLILEWYESGNLKLPEVLSRLEVKERRFYKLLNSYRRNKKGFTVHYGRSQANRHLAVETEQAIRTGLEADKALIDNPNVPIRHFNYSAIRDEVGAMTGDRPALSTIISRAKDWGYYMVPPPKRAHTREVLTEAVGMLLQHDSSHHLWSPFASAKWTLITTIDDHSRKLLYGDFHELETTWAHIQAAESVILKYGRGLAYYADNHSIFRFVSHRDSVWVNQKVGTDEATTQWKQCIEAAGMQVWYAMSPQAKGKIERPYSWLQDRVVRKCAKAGIADIGGAREILASELDRYNNYQVHSTTGEVPTKRFERAVAEGRTMFQPLQLAPPITSTKDIFCLRETRVVDGYRRVHWQKYSLPAPKDVPIGARVELHIIPELPAPEVRIWYQNKLRQVSRFNKE